MQVETIASNPRQVPLEKATRVRTFEPSPRLSRRENS
jgi:hypothetical protein